MLHSLKALVFALFCCLPAAAEDRPVIQLGYIEFPPFYYHNEAGEPQGRFFELAQTLTERAGYRIESQRLPARRYVSMIINGQVDFAIGINTDPGYEGKVLSSKVPVAYLTLTLYSRMADETRHLPGDFRGKRIALIRGYSYGGLKQQIDALGDQVYVLYVNDHAQGVQALFGRQLDYFLGYQEAIDFLMSGTDLPTPARQVIDRLPMYLLVPDKGDHSAELLRDLESAARLESDSGHP